MSRALLRKGGISVLETFVLHVMGTGDYVKQLFQSAIYLFAQHPFDGEFHRMLSEVCGSSIGKVSGLPPTEVLALANSKSLIDRGLVICYVQ
jgi:hypothetical protein